MNTSKKSLKTVRAAVADLVEAIYGDKPVFKTKMGADVWSAGIDLRDALDRFMEIDGWAMGECCPPWMKCPEESKTDWKSRKVNNKRRGVSTVFRK